jgi:hypothetical protein
MAIIVRPLTARLIDSAPEQGYGLHRWLIKGSRMCQTSGVINPNKMYDLIAKTVIAKGGEERPHDIWQAINKVLGSSFSGGAYEKQPAWPEPDLELIQDITLEAIERYGERSVLDVLWDRSPETLDGSPGIEPETTAAIMRRLFPEDALICAGLLASSTTTYELEKIAKNLHKFQFVVPSPMSAKTGLTQQNKESGCCLGNTGPRRFLVTEFDFKSTNDQGKPTKWAPLIDQWQVRGATIQCACAAIIMRLMKAAPLTMVVYSGKKSLHAWWYCSGESEHEGSRLHKFMVDAVRLGADPATFTRSQFVRMPGAIRPDTGRQQTVHYLDFKHVEGVNK